LFATVHRKEYLYLIHLKDTIFPRKLLLAMDFELFSIDENLNFQNVSQGQKNK
jgi:hypothetical protein